MRRAVAAMMLVAVGASAATAQKPKDEPRDTGGLAQAAARVREAWLAHDPAKIVANSPQLVVQLPGTDPSAPLGPGQAAALLATYLATAREVELVIRAAREVASGRGTVELVRRYRVNGTQDVRAQSLFLGYRRGPQGWALVELRAIGP